MDLDKNVLVKKESFMKSPFMLSLHTVEKGEPIDTQIYSTIDKVPWMAYQKAYITSSARKENENNGNHDQQQIYTPKLTMHYLFYSYLGTQLPMIETDQRLGGKVRIAWPRNLMHHIVVSGQVEFGTIKGPEIPSGWLDHQTAWFMKSGTGHESNYNRSIGNLRCLTDWNSWLPSKAIRCPQPWWFSQSESNAVPLFKCKDTPMSIRYNFNLHVLSLLRMQLYKGDEWVDVTDASVKARFLNKDGIDMRSTIPIPTMTGYYGKMADSELEWKRTIDQSVLATSIIKKNTQNPVESGKSATIKLDSVTPIYAIYFCASHEKSINIGNLSNYTTDPYDRYNGVDPIKIVRHNYSGNTADVQDLSDFSNMTPWYHSISSPREPGYGMYTICNHPHYRLPDIGIVFDKDLDGSIEFELAPSQENNSMSSVINKDDIDNVFNNTINNYIKTEQNSELDKYIISAYLMTCMKITYTEHGVIVDDGTKYKQINGYAPSVGSSRYE